MKRKQKFSFILLALSLTLASCMTNKKTISQQNTLPPNKDYITIEEAMASLKVPEAAAKFVQNETSALEISKTPTSYTIIEPLKLFDNLYFIGTTTVGAYIIDSGAGLIMLDTGCDNVDAAIMVEGIRKLGLNPEKIRIIFISHEHFDHYGGVQYLLKNICPDAKVAMSLVGWNMLQTVPVEWNYTEPRPQKADIFLTDGMKIKVGNEIVQVVSTPGHSPGCVSFIFQVTDNGEPHVAGIMGGIKVWPTQLETKLYKSSIEYFKAFAENAKCDIGLSFHPMESNLTPVRLRKSEERNPLIIGQEQFNSVYLQSFRNLYKQMLESGDLKPY